MQRNTRGTNSSKVKKNNENLGYLGLDSSKQATRRQQRIQQFKTQNDQPSLNTGNDATVMIQTQTATVAPQQVKPGNFGQSISLPPDIQQKINQWREKRALKEQQEQDRISKLQQQLQQLQSQQQYQYKPQSQHQSQPQSQYQSQPQPQYQSQPQPQPPQENNDGTTTSSSSSSSSPPPVLVIPVAKTTLKHQSMPLNNNNDSGSGSGNPPAELATPISFNHPRNMYHSQHPPPQLQAQSDPVIEPNDNSGIGVNQLFDASNQDILKKQVEFEVKKVLDLLKKERPELVNQSEVMNIVNQKTRKFEESLQQFNVREQRLREMVDQMNISIRAVQSNVDQTKIQVGGTYLTEEVMKSWVSHFFGEQVGPITTELRSNLSASEEKTHNIITQHSKSTEDAIKTLDARLQHALQSLSSTDNNIKTLEIKFQNTLQSISESLYCVYGTVMEVTPLYEKPDEKSKEISKCNRGDVLLLTYPIFKNGNDRWMKVRTVDQSTAQLGESWVPVFQNDVAYVGGFKMTP